MKHHIAVGDASFKTKGLRLDLSLKARYNKLIDNQEFVEKIATASCLSTPATRDII